MIKTLCRLIRMTVKIKNKLNEMTPDSIKKFFSEFQMIALIEAIHEIRKKIIRKFSIKFFIYKFFSLFN